MPGSMAEQTERVLQSIKGVLNDMGLTLDHVIKCNVFISSMDLFDEMNEVYIKHFGTDNPPARQTIAAGIWGGLDVEISAEILLED